MPQSPARIMGGMFGLEPPVHPGSAPPFIRTNSVLLANARSGIYAAVQSLQPGRVWMPSYLCHTMLQSLGKTPVQFYAVDENLTVSVDAMRVGQGDLVVVIDYFGFPAPRRLFEAAKACGAWVLEDACQALLTANLGQDADLVLYSPRKFLGVPDGGILTASASVDLTGIQLSDPPTDWAMKAFEAALLRHSFDGNGGARHWFTLFHQLDEECPVGLFAMSGLTRLLLMNGFDYPAIARARRENYAHLMNRLPNIALFPILPDSVVPLGFPVRLEARDVVRQALYDAQIYPPVHWPITGVVPEGFAESHQLNRRIMTLPCDQRYTTSDMDRMADIIIDRRLSPT